MSGSRIDVAYTADGGEQYCINCDESNIEMVMGAAQSPNGTFPRPPKGFSVRKVTLKDITGLISRTVPVLNLARYAAINGATPFTLSLVDSANGVDVRVFTKDGEKQRNIPKNFDTGNRDGD